MENVEKFTGELMTVINNYIDNYKMTTVEVCGVLDVISFRVKEASIPAEATSAAGEIEKWN